MTARAFQPDALAARARSFAGRHRLLVTLIAADAVTKVVAFNLLPHSEAVRIVPGLTLYLAVNDWGVMGGVHGIGPVTANPAYTMLLAVGLLFFAWVVVRLAASSLAFGWRLVAGAAVFFAVAFAAQSAAVQLPDVSMPSNVVVMTIRLAALMVSLAFYAASRAPIPRAIFTLFAAGALANAFSYTYPPFEVVDFLMIPIQPIAELIGSEVPSTTVGVINLADLYLFSVPPLLLAWPVLAVVTRMRRAG